MSTCGEAGATHAAVEFLQEDSEKVLFLASGHVGELPIRILIVRRRWKRIALSLVFELIKRCNNQAGALVFQLSQCSMVSTVLSKFIVHSLQPAREALSLAF